MLEIIEGGILLGFPIAILVWTWIVCSF